MQSVEGSMKVWRIEDPNGVGPWMSRHRSGSVLRDCPVTGHHPSNGPDVKRDCWGEEAYDRPDRDELMEGRVCAVRSLGQLKAWWFKDYHLQLLEDNGFVLREFDVPDSEVVEGRAQLAVKRDAMMLIAEHKPTYALQEAA
jgi:hypothetical protein